MKCLFLGDVISSKNSMDFSLQEMIDNQLNDQESVDKIKDEIMETDSFENQSYPDIAMDDSIEKRLNDL